MAMGQGGDGFYIPRPHTRFSYTYTLPYSYPTGMRKWTPSPIPTGSGIPPHPRLRIQYFFLIKIEVFWQPLEKCCNALSNNMLTLTFVIPIDLVVSLNINGSFYNTAIIKQITSHINIKVIFCIWVWVRGGYLYTCYPSHTRVLKSGKTQTHTPTWSKRGKPVKLSLVRVGNHGYGFCCHVSHCSQRDIKLRCCSLDFDCGFF